MDKVFEKIEELKKELENLYFQKDSIEDKIDFKVEERNSIYSKNEMLNYQIYDLKDKKNTTQYILSNIKKWEKNTILKTALIALCFVVAIILINLKFGWSFIGALIGSIASTPITVLFGESGNYYYNRKYLKKYRLEDTKKEIEEKEKEKSFNNKKIDSLESELIKLNTEKGELENKIDSTENEISELRNLRVTVIAEYLKNNQEFDNLVNLEYQKQKEKKIEIKKR